MRGEESYCCVVVLSIDLLDVSVVKQAIGIEGEVTDLGVADIEVAKSDKTCSREGVVAHSLRKVLCILHWNDGLVADDGNPDGELELATDRMRNRVSDMGFCRADEEVLHRSLRLRAITGIRDNPNADTNQAVQNLLEHGEQLVNGQIVGDGLCCEDEWRNFRESWMEAPQSQLAMHMMSQR